MIAKAVFDREEQDRYTLVIQAIDNPSALNSNQLSDSLLIKIRILDQNDNKPECDQDRYYLEVVQNVEIGTILSQIKGIDNDVGKNAQLRYFIHSNKTHDPTSTISEFHIINISNIFSELGIFAIQWKLSRCSTLLILLFRIIVWIWIKFRLV